MKIKVINKSKQQLPQYSTEASAGIDLRANHDKEIVLHTMVIAKHEKVEWARADNLSDTETGSCGFSHTGKRKL
jgi:dUTPase